MYFWKNQNTDLRENGILGIAICVGFRLVAGEESVGDHEKIGETFGCMGPEDKSVDGKRWVGGVRQRGLKWNPVDGERRPFERVGDDQIVKERRVLLPYGVVLLHLFETRLLLLFFRHLSVRQASGFVLAFLDFPPSKKVMERRTGRGVEFISIGFGLDWKCC